jgi:flagellar motor switch/type III secretory pathway protein FliN
MSSAVPNLHPNVQPISAVSEPARMDGIDSMPWLPCAISVELPVVRFTVEDLLSLKEGAILQTACHQTSDVPLRVNDMLVAWTEFEVVGERLAVRLTELA